MVCIYYFQVETLLDKLRVLYNCLVVPQEERSSLCIKEALSLEELCKVDKVAAIREEVAKWQAVKKENTVMILVSPCLAYKVPKPQPTPPRNTPRSFLQAYISWMDSAHNHNQNMKI